jgi:hypothetical protein
MRLGGIRKLFHSRYGKPLILILIGVLLIGSAAAVNLILTIPSTVISAQPATTTSACGGVLAQNGSPPAGTGTIRYFCPPSSGAFTVTNVGTDTPTFSPPSPVTSVGYISHSASSCSGFAPLASGTFTALTAIGDFDICAGYSCPTGCTISSWALSWSS